MKRAAYLVLGFFMLLTLAGCGLFQVASPENREVIVEVSKQDYLIKNKDAKPVAVPEDFSFALTWGAYGISSYDSASGKLVKTTDATDPENYVTDHTLTEEELAYVYDLISSLDVFSYPVEYDPGNGSSEPSMTLILTARFGAETRTIQAENISFSMTSKDEKGQAFLNACGDISAMLTTTPEWKALPDYERYYE